ncbi:MAG: PQQ-binding-like beta-propeller repeat protein [Gemmataceae bacterium]
MERFDLSSLLNRLSQAPLTRRGFCLGSGLATLGLLGKTGLVHADDRSRVYTRPEIPSDEALERLNLQLGWRAYIPVENKRDGIYSVQVLDKDILIQTRSGLVSDLDAETGKVLWRSRFGAPYRVVRDLGYNANTVFAVNNVELYALDRANGRELWHYRLPEALSAPLVGDDKMVYIAGSTRVSGLALPEQQTPEGTVKGSDKPQELPNFGLTETKALSILKGTIDSSTLPRGNVPQPSLIWEYPLDAQVEQTPAITNEFLMMPGLNGLLFVLTKANGKREYRLPLASTISLALASYGENAYIAAEDQTLYAINIVLGKVLWRFSSGTAILRAPEVSEEDIYLVTNRFGMHRLKRGTGEMVWRNARADRFLAANPKFVYALDAQGRLMVIDQARGKELTALDTRDFVIPIRNDRTDRLYMSANNGLIVCLHDRDYRRPVEMRKAEEKPQGKLPVKTAPKPPAPKPPPASDKPKEEPDKGDTDQKDKS